MMKTNSSCSKPKVHKDGTGGALGHCDSVLCYCFLHVEQSEIVFCTWNSLKLFDTDADKIKYYIV